LCFCASTCRKHLPMCLFVLICIRARLRTGVIASTRDCILVVCIIVPIVCNSLYSATTTRSLSSPETTYKQRVCIAPRTGRKWSTSVTEHRRKCVSPSSYITPRKTLIDPVSLQIFTSKYIIFGKIRTKRGRFLEHDLK